MKKPLIFLLLLFSSITFAEKDFSYEIIRTPESPGFFMAKIFASEDAKPLPMNEIFVKNYPKNEEKKYRELFPFLQQQRQARIVNSDEFNPQKIKKDEVVIILGDSLDNFLNFKHKEGDIFKEFQNFAKKNLSPILLDNLKITFGGNIFDVQTKQAQITADSPAIFVGKFKKPIKTRMEITGNRLESHFGLVSPLDLENKKYTQDKTAEYLPEIWNELAHPQNGNLAKKYFWLEKFNWLNIFPYILGIIGLMIILLIIKYLMKDDEEYNEFEYEEEVPIFQSRISEDEYQGHEKELERGHHEETDLPFEVIWKQ